MILGAEPSMTATAELVVPRSIPMTWPLTFSSPPSAYPLLNEEAMGDLKADERTEGVARSWKHVSEKLHKLWKLSHGTYASGESL